MLTHAGCFSPRTPAQVDASLFEDFRSRHEALEAKVSGLLEALKESEAQRAALKRAFIGAYTHFAFVPSFVPAKSRPPTDPWASRRLLRRPPRRCWSAPRRP